MAAVTSHVNQEQHEVLHHAETNMAAEDENKRTKERCRRFTERVNVNITEAGKLAQHMIRASGSPDILAQTTKKFVQNENTIKSTEENIKKMTNLIGQMDEQYDQIHQRYVADIVKLQKHQIFRSDVMKNVLSP